MTYTARRHDGWTAERQQQFLAALARTRSISQAAAAVGKSRTSAYALRARANAEAFARAWDAVVAPPPFQPLKPIDQIEVPLTRRGVLLGTRRRFDNRAALVRLRQLDRVVDRMTPEDFEAF